jgi:ABC-type proline/glycine betaine transport system ATPase subunit
LGNLQIVYRFFGNQNKAKTKTKTKNKNRKQIKQNNKATLGYNGYNT